MRNEDKNNQLDYSNSLAYEVCLKENKVNALGATVNCLNDALNDKNRKIKILKTEIKNTNLTYLSYSFECISKKMKIYKLSQYSKKIAKLTTSVTVLSIVNPDKNINANKYLPKSEKNTLYNNVKINSRLVGLINKALNEEAAKSISAIRFVKAKTDELLKLKEDVKNISINKKSELKGLKQSRNKARIDLLKNLKDYLQNDIQCSRMNKKLNKQLKK